jgi:flagellar motor protein MotB
MTQEGSIERQSHSYRQGLVLGLTMAEIMLLLVFCLLLAVGSIIKHQRDQINLANIEIDALKGTSSPLNLVLSDLISLDLKLAGAMGKDGSISQSKIDEFWTEIVEARETVRQLESKGLSKKDSRENAEFLSAAMDMKDRGESIETMKSNKELGDGMAKFQNDNRLEPKDIKGTLAKLEELRKLAHLSKGKDPEGHKWPPMISLSEAGGYYFKLGSAELSPEFEQRLHQVVVPILVKTAQEYDVDVIEVVGHTDELPVGIRNSNLDRDMVEVLKGAKPIIALRPGDNAGLGIARSVSVVRNLLQDQRLKGLRILPLSGAQLIKTNETLANGIDVQGDVMERRRIDIRLRKAGRTDTPLASGGMRE